MAVLQLFSICFLCATVSSVPTGFGFNSNWEENKKSGHTHPNFKFNPIVPDKPDVPEVVTTYNDQIEKLFREYLEQEKLMLESRLTFINSLFIKIPHSSPPVPKSPYVPYSHREGIVTDMSSGKILHIVLNLTGFVEDEIKHKIEDGKIWIYAIHEDQFYHRELRWTYQLPLSTDTNAIHFDFQQHILTISGTLSEDVFAANQNLYHNEMRKKFFHHGYPRKTPFGGKGV